LLYEEGEGKKVTSRREAMPETNWRLKLMRKAVVGVTQAQLADEIGVNEITVCKWETGRAHPSPEMRQRVADALGCKTFEIWDR